jgi:hypothetical protein
MSDCVAPQQRNMLASSCFCLSFCHRISCLFPAKTSIHPWLLSCRSRNHSSQRYCVSITNDASQLNPFSKRSIAKTTETRPTTAMMPFHHWTASYRHSSLFIDPHIIASTGTPANILKSQITIDYHHEYRESSRLL